MIQALAIFVFFFSVLNFLVSAYLLHQLLRGFAALAEVASTYTDGYVKVSAAFLETKNVVNNHAQTITLLLSRLDALGVDPEGTVAPRKRARRVRTPLEKPRI